MIFWEESKVISAEIIQIGVMETNSVQAWKSIESFPGHKSNMRCAENQRFNRLSLIICESIVDECIVDIFLQNHTSVAF
jgi:hypothetical protein